MLFLIFGKNVFFYCIVISKNKICEKLIRTDEQKQFKNKYYILEEI